MTFDEYRRYALMIIQVMRDFMLTGEDNVRQADIVDRMVN